MGRVLEVEGETTGDQGRRNCSRQVVADARDETETDVCCPCRARLIQIVGLGVDVRATGATPRQAVEMQPASSQPATQPDPTTRI